MLFWDLDGLGLLPASVLIAVAPLSQDYAERWDLPSGWKVTDEVDSAEFVEDVQVCWLPVQLERPLYKYSTLYRLCRKNSKKPISQGEFKKKIPLPQGPLYE